MQPEQNTKLYRSYVMQQGARGVLRHRGKSPRQAAFFFKSPELNFQSAQLASLFRHGLQSIFRIGWFDCGAL